MHTNLQTSWATNEVRKYIIDQRPALIETSFQRPNTSLKDTASTGSLCLPIA